MDFTIRSYTPADEAAAGAYLLSRHLLSYREVFALSAIARAAPLVVLGAALPRWAIPKRLPRLYTRLLSVRPGAGASERPLPIEADGEVLGTTPASFEVLRDVIRLKV